MTYTVYTKSNCPNCTIAKNFLSNRGIEFTEVSLNDPELRALFIEAYPGVKSVPVVTDEDGNITIIWKTETKV